MKEEYNYYAAPLVLSELAPDAMLDLIYKENIAGIKAFWSFCLLKIFFSFPYFLSSPLFLAMLEVW